MQSSLVTVYYCLPTPVGGYGAGMTRMSLTSIGKWLQEQLAYGKPVLITSIVPLKTVGEMKGKF